MTEVDCVACAFWIVYKASLTSDFSPACPLAGVTFILLGEGTYLKLLKKFDYDARTCRPPRNHSRLDVACEGKATN
jgi:hypothetical protein